MKRRVLTVLLIAIMTITFMPSMSFAEEGDTFLYKGVIYKVASEEEHTATVYRVTNKFDGTFNYNVKKTISKDYFVEEVEEPVIWDDDVDVTTVRIPDQGFFCAPYTFKNATKVKTFKVWSETGTQSPNHAAYDGILYETDYYDTLLDNATLVMYPPAKAGMETLELIPKCSNIYENAFDYSDGAKSITKLIINNDSMYIDEMDYEDSTSLFERLALKSDGKYNLTIRIPSPINSNSIASFVKFANWCRTHGKEGIKLEAPIESIYVKDVTYANRNKAKVYFGDVQLKKGEDYVLGDCNKVGNKLSNYNYCTLITGDNNFFLASDEEPWYDFSVVSEYSVTPNKVKSVKISGGKKKLTYKWKADKTKYGKSKNITGYEVAYENQDSTDYKFKKIKGYKKTSTTVKNLKKGSYYVKMRSYKSLGGGEYVYSAWSTEKVIEVK